MRFIHGRRILGCAFALLAGLTLLSAVSYADSNATVTGQVTDVRTLLAEPSHMVI